MAEAAPDILSREGPAGSYVLEPAFDLLDDVDLVLDVLKRGVVVEPVYQAAYGLLRTRSGHSWSDGGKP